MPVNRDTPLYKVWEVLNQSEDDARLWGAIDVPNAARCHARAMDSEEPFDTYPRDFMVIDPDGVRWRVSVDRVIQYDYRAIATKEKA